MSVYYQRSEKQLLLAKGWYHFKDFIYNPSSGLTEVL
ncbi:hypothetical protein SAMN05216382_1523 [Sphingomonas palmae]|uniref:Uncharacterized protein n=1 Tax=Sphingomonas palmae TaxID=1855283 RepID=A0A1H7MK83_9SPHN|nr:hypothetical protein SAMN05216382_1523 [Sphingomonas palmae]